jgi:hypothetical protein
MNILLCLLPLHRRWFALMCALLLASMAPANDPEVPEVLKPWEDWVTWGVKHRDCPKLYSSAQEAVCFWPSKLELSATEQGATWQTSVDVFEQSWVPLPGTVQIWPIDVRVGDDLIAVVQRDGRPAVQLPAGKHDLSGEFRWDKMPQRIAIPQQIGILSLSVAGSDVPNPNWDTNGGVWLRRTQGEPADKDLLNLQVYRVIEDGIPLWMRIELELTVAGKSREEPLGWILPEGWQIATVDSPIPVAVDDRGVAKAQVRAGKWIIAVHAFRTTDPGEIRFAPDAEVAAPTELVGLKTDPQFRISQIEGLPLVDVTQTTLPSKWRELPIYQWDTSQPFQLVEKMRGMGEQTPEGLTINRRLWLDEDGRGMTYRDQLRGQMQQIWRLDVADGNQLGAVRVDGQGQLITANPKTDASGVEIRSRNLNMEAIGRAPRTAEIMATGWQTDAESLEMTLTLPPGWRVFAVFGADQVIGDWLTAWSLLDLFLLLIFSLAVFRLFGVWAGIVALLAFGLAYHEPGAPRLTWLLLLMPLALLRVVGDGAAKQWLLAWKYAAVALLLLCLIPFVARQLQGAIYPQLEKAGTTYGGRTFFALPIFLEAPRYQMSAEVDFDRSGQAKFSAGTSVRQRERVTNTLKQIGLATSNYSNLLYDPKAKIQTGPAEPKWNWNNVYCVWNGPVTSQQKIQPILISLPQHRVLTVLRLALLMLLSAILLGVGKIRLPWLQTKAKTATAALALLLFYPNTASAQLPDQNLLDALRQRLLETSDAFPNAAEIPSVDLTIQQNSLEMKTQIHAAAEVAVPLPGKLPAWSPISITMDDDSEVIASRRDGYLWIVVPKGVHEVVVKGLLSDKADWEWTFLLKPKYVTIDAPGWKTTGVSAAGVPDRQVFFAQEQQSTDDEAYWDRTDFNTIAVVDRFLEIGLVSKVHNTVTRLSEPGKAISLDVPLLPGEGVLTAGRDVSGGTIAVRLGAQQETFQWDSELPSGAEISLVAPTTDRWVERWHLVTSPVWNVNLAGLNPIYEANQAELIPVWRPWPEEAVTLNFSKPVAVSGDIMTVQHVHQETSLGSRRRTSKLELDLECSLAGDFLIKLDPEAEISSLTVDQNTIPVQRDGAKLIVPARPGKQQVTVAWNTGELMDTTVSAGAVELPVEASNLTTVMMMPENRWILWAAGPLRGPAVRFWTILAVAILAALALGSLPGSPLRRWEWLLLAIGLTQVPLLAAMTVVGWLFLLAWRGSGEKLAGRTYLFDLLQLVIISLTLISLLILMMVVGAGLLGNPDMFIVGNGSSRTYLRWFQPRSGPALPTPYVISISVWFYRLLMLFWALWLATALLRWLTWGWEQFTRGGAWRHRPKRTEKSSDRTPAVNES